MPNTWIADRMHQIDASGIRKVFDLASKMKNPINLGIGQPHFDTPEPVKRALCEAVMSGKNVYSATQGIAPLREALERRVAAEFAHSDRQTFITSGTSWTCFSWATCTMRASMLPVMTPFRSMVNVCGETTVIWSVCARNACVLASPRLYQRASGCCACAGRAAVSRLPKTVAAAPKRAALT